MGKDPAVLFYTSDFLTGTLTMKDSEVGKYIKLLCLQHQKGRLTEEDMLFICSTYVESVYSKFQKDNKGLYYNKRMEDESLRRKRYSESRRKNVSKRYKPTYVLHMETETENRTKDVSVIDNKNKVYIHPLQKFIFENLKQVAKLGIPTEKEMDNLISKYTQDLIIDKLWAMENKRDLLKKYNSTYLTLNNWCKNGTDRGQSSGSVKSRLDYRFNESNAKKRLDEIREMFG